MAIQLRRGDYADFDPSQLLDGELAIVLENDPDTDDGTGTYVSYGDSNVKRLLTADEQVEVPTATTSTAGIVKPDGTSITVDNDGTIHGANTYTHPSYTARTGKPTANQTPGFGDTFTVSQVKNDSTGHVSEMNDRTVKIPDATATAAAAGLMSATDKSKLDGVEVADWNENDSTSGAYIENRPFYSVQSVGNTVLAQTSCGGSASNEMYLNGTYYALVAENVSTSYDITSGSIYQVTVGTSVYMPTATGSVSYNMTGGAILTGASSLLIGNVCLIVRTGYKQIAVLLPGRKSQTISSKSITIKSITETITTIPTKYLPDATTSVKGAMTASDKTKLNGVASGATANTPSSATPAMDGTASAGSSTDYARGDHVHPTDTSRAAASDLTSHTGDTTVHVTAAERSTWNAKASTSTATTSANGLMSSTDKSKLDSIDTSAIATATANANNAATNANTAATAANTAATSANDAAERAEDAIEAIGDISEQAVPLMSPTTRGGAKVGHGLTVEDGALGIGSVTDATDAGPIVELTAKGWAEQDTTTGKNLLPNEITTVTSNGVTFTKNADGSVKVNGTATALTQVRVATNYSLPVGTYTLSGCPSGGGSSTFDLRTSSNIAGGQAAIDTGSGATFSVDDANEGIQFPITIRSGYTANNLTFYPQLELGSTATPYEPYTGAAPSPSPSYPQEIRRVTGRNLVNESTVLLGKGLTSANSLVDSSVSHTTDYIPIVEGRDYVISADTWDSTAGRSLITYNASKAVVRTLSITNMSYKAHTFTAQSNEAYVRFSYYKDATTIQMEIGSTATPYVPYGYLGMEVQGQNHIDTTKVSQARTHNGISYTVQADGGIKVTGTATANSYMTLAGVNIPQGVILGKTYTLSGTHDGVVFNASDNTTSPANRFGDTSLTTTIPATATTWAFALYVYSGTTVDTIIYPQLEDGSEATEYEPYIHQTIPIPLPSKGFAASLPDGTSDILHLDGAGGYEWENQTDEMTFDGSGTWMVQTGGKSIATNMIDSLARPSATTTDIANAFCSHFVADTAQNVYYIGDTGMSLNPANNDYRLRFADGTGSMTVESWKSWLASHPVTVLYPLATPVTERGYVDMPTVPVHATLTCLELRDLAVRCCADEGAAEISAAWGKRLSDVTETLQSDLAEAVTDTVAARIEIATVSTNEAYDAQVINGTYEGRNIVTILGAASFDAAVAQMHTLAQSRGAGNLRLGDYIDVKPTVNTVNKGANIRYRIAGIGHCYQFGDSSCPWAFWMVPDAPIDMTGSTYAINTSYIYWNTTADNNGTTDEHRPYLASNLHAWELGEFLPAMPTSLQNVMVNHRILFEERYSASAKLEDSTGWSWGDAGKVFSLSETEVYGQCVWGTKGFSVGADAQLPLFALAPRRRLSGNRVARWLRSVRAGSASGVCYVYGNGQAHYGSATGTWVCPWPCFLIG